MIGNIWFTEQIVYRVKFDLLYNIYNITSSINNFNIYSKTGSPHFFLNASFFTNKHVFLVKISTRFALPVLCTFFPNFFTVFFFRISRIFMYFFFMPANKRIAPCAPTGILYEQWLSIGAKALLSPPKQKTREHIFFYSF